MLHVSSLSCRRGSRLVFREVGFCLAPGALLQITGANGSGKSTLLRVLAGLLSRTDGAITWNDQPVGNDAEAHRARVHYIGHLDALKPELTGVEMLAYWQSLRAASAACAADLFGIDAFKNKPVRFLSAGQKRRLALSRLLQDDAPLWLLDEPTTALDENGQARLAAAIAHHRAKGGIVIAAVHHAMNAPDAKNFAMLEAKR